VNRIEYEMRGWAYWAECANPFRDTVTARKLPLGLRIEGYKLDAVGRGLYRRGLHEPGLTRFLLQTFSNDPGKNFIDVGANNGYFTCLLAKLAGTSGKVVAVEPEPRNRQLLERNVRKNGLTNVRVHGFAVGATDGMARMGIYKAANRGRHSLVDLESCKKFIQVPVRRLDDLVEKENVKAWALTKLDVEGYEPFVFEGGEKTLARTEILVMEYSPGHWRKAGTPPEAVFERLKPYFPHVHRFEGTEMIPTTVDACLSTESTHELVLRR
jgi:FkbM family methyltransferase